MIIHIRWDDGRERLNPISRSSATVHVSPIIHPLESSGKPLSLGMASPTLERPMIQIKCKLPFVGSLDRIEAVVNRVKKRRTSIFDTTVS
jgi:hypothetical protein